MQAVYVLLYLAAAVSFAVAIFHRKVEPKDLDLVALGLFLAVLPTVIRHLF